MERRELLRRLCAAGAAPVLNPLWPTLSNAAGMENWQADFEASAAPWKMGYATPRADMPLLRAAVRGRFPDAVAGTLYRIGPAGHDLGGERYRHAFDGDGMVHRFVIEGGQVHHQGRFVATSKRAAELAAGRRLAEAFGTVPVGSSPPTSADNMNAANISVLPLHNELLALWEGGSATRIDARTLETLGLKTWRADLAGMPFSAHPRVAPDGTVWNFGVAAPQGLLVLYEIAPEGTLRRAGAVPIAELPSVHDFAVTERHLVFLMPPLVFDGERKKRGASFLDAHRWRPELGMRVLVIDKANWERRRLLELPAGFLFHIGNAWEESTPGGTLVHIDYARSDDAEAVLTSAREVMRGRRVKTAEPRLTTATLNLTTGVATQTVLPFDAEFPRIDPLRVGLRHRTVVHATHGGREAPGFGAVAVTDVETGRSQHFGYGPQAIVEEHLFVPDPRGAGWILGTALDFGRDRTVLSCFAADHLAAGPVAQAALAHALPLGLHGNFAPAPGSA